MCTSFAVIRYHLKGKRKRRGTRESRFVRFKGPGIHAEDKINFSSVCRTIFFDAVWPRCERPEAACCSALPADFDSLRCSLQWRCGHSMGLCFQELVVSTSCISFCFVSRTCMQLPACCLSVVCLSDVYSAGLRSRFRKASACWVRSFRRDVEWDAKVEEGVQELGLIDRLDIFRRKCPLLV